MFKNKMEKERRVVLSFYYLKFKKISSAFKPSKDDAAFLTVTAFSLDFFPTL